MAARKPVTDEEIAGAYTEGLSTRIAADRYGVDKTLVTRRLRKTGVPLRSRGIARKSEPVARNPAKRSAALTKAVAAEVTTPAPLPLRKIGDLPPSMRDKAHAALTRFVAYARARRLAREFEEHEEGELL